MPPLIAIPGRRSDQATGFRTPVVGAGQHYLDALVRAGAAPLVLHPGLPVDALADVLGRADGLLLLGGGDVDPSCYGSDERHPTLYDLRRDQDDFEMAALRCAISLGMPVLAVCRGAQLLNVACGGTLRQHIGDDESLDEHRGVVHPVSVAAGSRVAALVGGTKAAVASRHHQAVDVLGAGLTVTARAPDGIVEAVELDAGWVVGVQWHPEDTAATDPAQQSVFDGFVAHAAGSRHIA